MNLQLQSKFKRIPFEDLEDPKGRIIYLETKIIELENKLEFLNSHFNNNIKKDNNYYKDTTNDGPLDGPSIKLVKH
jgi:hypothetical protein